MKTVPKYLKIMNLGSIGTENALKGPVILQEKVDGSQFRLGINEDGELVMGSKNQDIIPEAPAGMFQQITDYLLSIKGRMLELPPDTYLYGEYLQKPKHNVLKYDHIPSNHLVLFDAIQGGAWLSRQNLIEIAQFLDFDVIPEFYRGEVCVDTIREFLKEDSFLGREKVEGVVMKNHDQYINLGNHVFPLFTKYVREEYKERHHTEEKEKNPKVNLDLFIQGFRSEARWNKTFQHLRDAGKLTQSPKDIGDLIREVQADILEEESLNIKSFLFNHFKKNILGTAIKGLPEWYKEKLLENLTEASDGTT